MHAYILLGSNFKDERDLSMEFTFAGGVGMTDVKKMEFLLQKIADVRELNKFTRLKLTEKTAIIIRDFDHATEEAQNAFLKQLEEPQDNLTYVLFANSIDKILPTVVSRCEVVEAASSTQQVVREEKKKIQSFVNSEIGEKLKVISKINKREEAMQFMKNIIIVGHEQMDNFNMLDNAIKTLNNLEANGNVQLQLTNFAIGL